MVGCIIDIDGGKFLECDKAALCVEAIGCANAAIDGKTIGNCTGAKVELEVIDERINDLRITGCVVAIEGLLQATEGLKQEKGSITDGLTDSAETTIGLASIGWLVGLASIGWLDSVIGLLVNDCVEVIRGLVVVKVISVLVVKASGFIK